MADRYLLESGSPDGYLLEDSSGVLLLNAGDWNPSYIPGINIWLSASDTTTLFTDAGVTNVSGDGQSIQQWNDKSGNAKNVTQATAGLRPLYKTGSGAPYIQFDGSDDQMDTASSTQTDGSGQFWIAVAVALDTTTGNQGFASTAGVALHWVGGGSTAVRSTDSAAATTDELGPTVVAGTPFVYIATIIPAAAEVYADTVTNGSTALSGTRAMAAGVFSVGTGLGFIQGRVYELAHGKGILSSADRSLLQTYFAARTVQTLTPSLFTNSQTFYAPTVALSGQTLTPNLFTNSQTFYAPTVTPGTTTLTPLLFTNTNTFYGPTVAAGAVALTPALFTNAQSFFAPTVSPGAVTLTPALFTNSQTFFVPSVAPGSVTLTPSLFTNAQSFFAPTVSPGGVTLTPSLFTNSQSFFATTVAAGGVTLTPALFTNSQSFFAPTVTASYTLQPDLFTNVQTFYAATVTQPASNQTLVPSLFTNTNTFHPATVSPGAVTLTPNLFTNAQIFYSVTLVGGPTLNRSLGPSLFTNPQVFYASKVTRIFLDTIIVPGSNLINEAYPPAAAFGSVTELSSQIVDAPSQPAADLA